MRFLRDEATGGETGGAGGGAGDLGSLGAEARRVDAGLGADPAAAPGGARSSGDPGEAQRHAHLPPPEKILGAMLLGTGRMLAIKCPSVGKVYTPERCEATAGAIVGACEAMGWNLQNVKLIAVLGGLGSVGMLAWDTAEAVRADMARDVNKRPGARTGGGLDG